MLSHYNTDSKFFLSGFPKAYSLLPITSQSSSNSRTHATVHDGQIVTETVQRRAPRNVGNTGSRGNQSYGNMTTATGKKVICYNCRGEGHVARQYKEPKRAKDSQYFKDKMLLMEAKEKGVTLDAEAEAFLANVIVLAPYRSKSMEVGLCWLMVFPLAMAYKTNNPSKSTMRSLYQTWIRPQCCQTAFIGQSVIHQANVVPTEVLTDKKKLEDKYLDEIVCLKSANKVATDLLQKFQMPTHTIPMLSKKPKNASHDLHKDILGRSNPRYGKKAPVINASNVWDTDETLASAEVSMAKMKGKPGHV
ncbi:hypothetical protein Tco_1078800 [Tanacetum coccineum]|uniref:CCHC-type domain-containing protein n=1 Tax=Tanacetum coccineum TaxID=301880 RepID=A0ABQ5HRN9_9ASTR